MSLDVFIAESNRIEGIERPVKDRERAAHEVLLGLRRVTVADLEAFVAEVAGAYLRDKPGWNVMVGGHFPPKGGPVIREHLDDLLLSANKATVSPWQIHVRYELLHPFTDGNGRSGRALWAWQVFRQHRDPFALPFLHRFYYDTLSEQRA